MRKLLLLLFLLPSLGYSQNVRRNYAATDPTGGCANNTEWVNTTSHLFRYCDMGVWRSLTGSSTVAIGSAVTSGSAQSVLYVGAGGVFAQDNTHFTFDFTNLGLHISGTTSGYALDLSTTTTDGLRITSTLSRSGILFNSVDTTQQIGSFVYQSNGVTKWQQVVTGTTYHWALFNATNSLNILEVTPGTIDTASTVISGGVATTRTTTNNSARGVSVTLNDNNTTGTPGGSEVDGINVAYTAGASATQEGNGIGVSSGITITASGAHANSGNEFASYLGANTSNSSNAIRQWGAFDFSSHSSISVADDFIQGGSLVVNRYNTGANRNGSGGLFIYTKPNQGAAPHTGSTTYPIQVGLQIVGWSGATTALGDSPSNTTLSSRTQGFITGIRVGGPGSGWDSPYLSDKSRIGTGISIEDIDTYGINIQNPYQGTTPPKPTMIIGSGSTWKDGIDWDAVTFSGYSQRLPNSFIITKGSIISPSGGFGNYSNWLANSEDLTASGWTDYCTAMTKSANSTDFTAPDGSTHATKLVSVVPGGVGCQTASGIQFDNGGTALTVGQSYTVSVWLRGASGGEVFSLCVNDGNCTTSSITLTNYWRRYVYTVTSYVTDTNTKYFQLITTTNALTIYAWGAQTENSLTANVYLKTAASNNKTAKTGGVVNGNQFVNGFSRELPQLFSALSTCDATIEGATASVTDSNTVTWGATIAGSSTNHVLAYCNGTNWTVAGK